MRIIKLTEVGTDRAVYFLLPGPFSFRDFGATTHVMYGGTLFLVKESPTQILGLFQPTESLKDENHLL